MTSEGGGAQEPNKEPATNGTPSPSKRNVSKAKRLLPMELRKRRRAAKLQVSAEKKARVASGAASLPQSPSASARSPGKTETTDEPKEEERSNEVSRKATSDEGSPAKEMMKASQSESTPQKSPQAKTPTATASTRLHSLYNSSLLNQRAHNRRLVPGANVPNTFQVAELPLDIVPKTKLSILTAFPYPFQRVTSKIKQQALQNFISGGDNIAQQSASQSTAVRWQQALHYFVHPADPVPASVLINRAAAATSEPLLGGPKGEHMRDEKAFFTARWNTWQQSFRDVYMNFRRQSSSVGGTRDGSFYLRSSEFVVYFLYDIDNQDATGNDSSIINLCRQHDEGTKSSESPTKKARKRTKNCHLRAVMSQSSARIRKVLHHLNVEYTMPYIKANQTQREAGEFHLLKEELEATSKRNTEQNGDTIMTRTTVAPDNMHGADSLLLFHGHDAVHGLYEFLINRAPMSNQDVPVLYALYPFASASIKSLQVTSFGRVGAPVIESVSEDQSSRSATLFRIEIFGFCFPSSIARLLAVLKDEWEATHSSYDLLEPTTGGKNAQIVLRTYMEALAGAERLNAVKLDEQAARGSGNEQQERQKRQQELEFSKRRMEIAAVTKMESRYDVETTSRTIVVRR
ncbi:hypothetical protein, variant [Phytophthora nicotianae P1569]|uniref:Uncharacterized protein n=1 Tax=Phytophthora nicotianae P1569 TaxID=1317065 RepID=V9FHZ1_PHYNI|nr:hypothetical protein F443_06066 [Phytophthora nicotianae P1569]ETI50384.1 hypothetical protein, variant [Phytophthora nicotianae P1569]